MAVKFLTLGAFSEDCFNNFQTGVPKSVLYFRVMHPVAHTLSRLLEEPSLATTANTYSLLTSGPRHNIIR
jgi:hypothetical protein